MKTLFPLICCGCGEVTGESEAEHSSSLCPECEDAWREREGLSPRKKDQMKCVGCDVEVGEAEFTEVQQAVDQIAEFEDQTSYERIVFWGDSLASGRDEKIYRRLWQHFPGVSVEGFSVPVMCRKCHEHWLKQDPNLV